MKLLILGKNPQDKGKQLERLTFRLLEKLDYRNLHTNASGPHEIDVRGDFVLPSLDQGQTIRVICECKAHESPIATTDWLKFLGKVYFEQAKLNKEVHGCLIALSGANGNVADSYDLLQTQGKTNIALVKGDRLSKLILDNYSVAKADMIDEEVRKFTARQPTRFLLSYYEGEFYWLIEFENSAFTLLSSNGGNVESHHEIVELVKSTTASGEFISLDAEHKAETKRRMDEKILLACLMLLGGKSKFDTLLTKWSSVSKGAFDVNQNELDQAARRLEEGNIIKINDSTLAICVTDINQVANLYKCYLEGETIKSAIGCSFYDNHINRDLLNKICEIQCGLVIPQKEVDDCLRLLLWSPTALATSLHPLPMIVNHRQKDGFVPTDEIDSLDLDYFMSHLYESFEQDYQNPQFMQYFAAQRGIIEIDANQVIKVKSSNELITQFENRKRVMIAKRGDIEGRPYVHMLMPSGALEPWELKGKLTSTQKE